MSRLRGFSALGRTESAEHTFKNEAEPQNYTGEVTVTDEQVDEDVLEDARHLGCAEINQ